LHKFTARVAFLSPFCHSSFSSFTKRVSERVSTVIWYFCFCIVCSYDENDIHLMKWYIIILNWKRHVVIQWTVEYFKYKLSLSHSLINVHFGKNTHFFAAQFLMLHWTCWNGILWSFFLFYKKINLAEFSRISKII
jgi:hypothetical protein